MNTNKATTRKDNKDYSLFVCLVHSPHDQQGKKEICFHGCIKKNHNKSEKSLLNFSIFQF